MTKHAPAKRPRRRPRRPGRTQAGTAFPKCLQALTQYKAPEGRLPGRAAVERLPDGTEHRTGIWVGHQKARRDQLDASQLDASQLAALAELGVDWPAL
ncbi:hypothetical protein ABZY81_38015 [Streptomyces sp. NPDC006514]|uniref:hypothetical protein n=1 Tax=Streptomyces sp. NPDC006514 TaxID=3154308 RepID=UPI0033AA362C